VQYSRRDALLSAAATAAATAAAASSRLIPSFDRAAHAATAKPSRWPIPTIVPRAQWGADEHLRIGPATYDTTVEKLIIHHTVTQNNRGNRATLLRNVYTYHLSHLYNDIAYNLVIDELGTIYEGRWAADYAANAPHTGEDNLRRQVRGAHSLNWNSRTIGIALLGTFNTVTPPTAMVNSLVEVLAWKCGRWHIDPTGSSPYKDGTGQTTVLPNIIGHRDVRQTLCPGSATRAILPAVRSRVKAIVDARLDSERRAFWEVLPGAEQRTRPLRG
jgi:N-acetylmuramoyl-L-alanine amidase